MLLVLQAGSTAVSLASAAKEETASAAMGWAGQGGARPAANWMPEGAGGAAEACLAQGARAAEAAKGKGPGEGSMEAKRGSRAVEPARSAAASSLAAARGVEHPS